MVRASTSCRPTHRNSKARKRNRRRAARRLMSSTRLHRRVSAFVATIAWVFLLVIDGGLSAASAHVHGAHVSPVTAVAHVDGLPCPHGAMSSTSVSSGAPVSVSDTTPAANTPSARERDTVPMAVARASAGAPGHRLGLSSCDHAIDQCRCDCAVISIGMALPASETGRMLPSPRTAFGRPQNQRAVTAALRPPTPPPRAA